MVDRRSDKVYAVYFVGPLRRNDFSPYFMIDIQGSNLTSSYLSTKWLLNFKIIA